MLSIVMPVLDEGEAIVPALTRLAPFRRRSAEVIVADGGSRDRTAELARLLADRIVTAPRGRASQMNAGAAQASGDVLLFLHADTVLPADADRLVPDGLRRSGNVWGRFDIRIDGANPWLPVVAAAMNARSRVTGIATGDQAIFVAKSAFVACGGYPDIALMEDIALSRRLKRLGRPLCLRERVVTSGRRWDEHGLVATVLLMWRLRLAYFLGADPAVLARRYGYVPPDR